MAKRAPWIHSDWVKARLYHLLAPLVALGLVALLQQTTLVERLENVTVGYRFQARAPLDSKADPRLVFVGIDQQSLDQYGRYPWRRTVIADFLNNMAKAGVTPHTLAFDIFYSEKSENPDDDTALGDAAGQFGSVITGALAATPTGADVRDAEEKTKTDLQDPGQTQPFTQIFGDKNNIRGYNIAALPVTPLRKQSLFAFVNAEADFDGIRHTIPLIIRLNDKVYPSLALQTLCQMLHVDADNVIVNVGQNVVLKNSSGKTWTIPIDDSGKYLINYRRDDTFTDISFGVLGKAFDAAANHGARQPYQLNNKTLLIGEAAIGLIDRGPSPLEGECFLPYTHLNVINNVLQNDYLAVVPWYWVVLGWALLTWGTLLRLKDALLVEAVAMPILAVVIYTIFAFWIFWLWSIQIALAWPVLSYGAVNFGGVVLRWREEQRGREQIKQVFSRMLSPEIMGHLLDHTENLEMGGSERAVTILFSDIRDYTKFSEGLKPAEVVRQLNVYFERMVACVQESRGTLHKYIGDAIMAAWGDIADASLGPEKDARNAVRSALMMRRRLRELNEERKTGGLLPLRIGIGLNHGTDVLVGLIGASSRSEFTVMGDPVNVASRLEGATKEFHTDLAISESVYDLLGGDFLVRRLGLIVLKGKTKPIVVYEVLSEKSNASQSRMTPETVALYEDAFDDFLLRRFTEAEAGFLACKKLYPDDYCVNKYLAASREFSAQPPPPDWDGRIVMETK
jgi:adenylate cyclase